jgi:hypothetical protein
MEAKKSRGNERPCVKILRTVSKNYTRYEETFYGWVIAKTMIGYGRSAKQYEIVFLGLKVLWLFCMKQVLCIDEKVQMFFTYEK